MTAPAIDATGKPLPDVADETRVVRRRNVWRRILAERSARIGLLLLGFLGLRRGFRRRHRHPPTQPGDDRHRSRSQGSRRAIDLLGCPADQPQHIFGLDGNVRDQFSRVIYGSRVSLFVGFVTVFGAILIGTAIGAVAGFAGGRSDSVFMRIMDILLAFPRAVLGL